MADLNGDGRPDLIYTNQYPFNTVSVLLGIGGESFAPATEFATGPFPQGLAVADLNGDGKLDLVVANSESSTVSVLLGNGDGTFQPRTDLQGTGGTGSVAIGDLNGDGHADLVVGNQNASTFSVWLGNGDGTFGPRADIPVEMYTRFVAIADLDGDGKADVVTANRTTNVVNGTISVLLGNGDGSFRPRTNYTVGPGPFSIAIGDLNADGKLDLAVANHGYGSQVISGGGASVLLGNGDGTFGPRTDYPIGGDPTSIAIGDLNGDGRPDLAVVYPPYPSGISSYRLGDTALLFGNGDGTFGSKILLGTFRDLGMSVAIADLNGDGKSDLVSSEELLFGNGDGSFGFDRHYAGHGSKALAVVDLNGDGNPDAVLAGYGLQNGAVSVWLGNPDATFGPRADYAPGGGGQYHSMAVGDLNGDGHLDVAVPDYTRDSVKVVPGLGDGTFGAPSAYPTGHNPSSIAIADLNGDGRPDLVVANEGSNSVSVLLQTPGGTLGPRVDFAVGDFPEWVAVGDLNGDGHADLAVANYNASTVSVLLGNGAGGFGPNTEWVAGNGTNAVAIADVNGDGKPDLVAATDIGNALLLGNGDGSFQPETDFGFSGFSLVIGDVNGDGRPDLVVAGNDISVQLGNGAGAFTTEHDYDTRGFSAIAVADLNHDGRPELVVANTGADRTLAVMLNTGGLPLGVSGSRSSGGPLQLAPAQPNPSRGIARLRFRLPAAALVALDILDVSGRRVRTLSGGQLPPGDHSLVWDGRDSRGGAVAAGVYLGRLRAGPDFVQEKLVRIH